VTSANDANQESRQNAWQSAWPGIVRIIIVEVVLLLALAVALVYYLNWSSEAAVSEFMSNSNAPLQAVKNRAPCDRSA
jgi:LPS O-antigen subunit length determinant protein (WzzB/FepE family)